MPIHKTGGGYKWGSHGKVYPTREGAAKQAAAAYASGYKGDHKNSGGMMGMWNPTYANQGRGIPSWSQLTRALDDKYRWSDYDKDRALEERIKNIKQAEKIVPGVDYLGHTGEEGGAFYHPGEKGIAGYKIGRGKVSPQSLEAVDRHEWGHAWSDLTPGGAEDTYKENPAATLHEEAFASRLADKFDPNDPLSAAQHQRLEDALGTYARAAKEGRYGPTGGSNRLQYENPYKPGELMEPGAFYAAKQLNPAWFDNPENYRQWVGPQQEVAQDYADWRFGRGTDFAEKRNVPLGTDIQAVPLWQRHVSKYGRPTGDYWDTGEVTSGNEKIYQMAGDRNAPTSFPLGKPSKEARANYDAYSELYPDSHDFDKGYQFNPKFDYGAQLQAKKEKEAAKQEELRQSRLPQSKPSVQEYVDYHRPDTQAAVSAQAGRWSRDDINRTQEQINEARRKSTKPYATALADKWQETVDIAKKNKGFGAVGTKGPLAKKDWGSDEWAGGEFVGAGSGGTSGGQDWSKKPEPAAPAKKAGPLSGGSNINKGGDKPMAGGPSGAHLTTAPSKLPSKTAQQYLKTHRWSQKENRWVERDQSATGKAKDVIGSIGSIFGVKRGEETQ